MIRIKLQFLSVLCALMMTNNVIADVTTVFQTPVTNFFISQDASPSQEESSFDGSLSYTPGLWAPGQVTSAIFRVYLSDDLSTNFDPNADSPVEYAQLTSVTDGSAVLSGLPIEVEVHVSPFDPALGAALIEIATAAGIESPTVLPSETGALYFDLDVTALLNSSNSGSLDFSLSAPDKFPDIDSATQPITHALITEIILSLDENFDVEDPYHVWEDYIYEYAELTVTYEEQVILPTGPENIPTLSEWGIMLLMAGLACFAGLRLRFNKF